MTKIYTAPTLAQVELHKSVLEEQGIACMLRNQYLAIGQGEIPYTETWPQLWIMNDADAATALALLNGRESAQEAPAWTCALCGEENEGQFSSCWNCSQRKTEPETV